MMLKNLKMIVATSKNSGIGYKGKMPWYIPTDMKFFKKMTVGNGNNAVVMGNNTWNSLPGNKHLVGRANLILSKKNKLCENREGDDVITFDNIDSIKEHCIERNYDETWIIGGTQIYNMYIQNPDLVEIYKTHINHDFECDTFFPKIPANFEMKMLGSNVHQTLFYWIEKHTPINQNKDCL